MNQRMKIDSLIKLYWKGRNTVTKYNHEEIISQQYWKKQLFGRNGVGDALGVQEGNNQPVNPRGATTLTLTLTTPCTYLPLPKVRTLALGSSGNWEAYRWEAEFCGKPLRFRGLPREWFSSGLPEMES